MTQEEILDYNKRCAEFLDIVTEEPHWVEFNKFMPNSITMSYGRRHHIEQLQFHSDWNWIMDIVEVIEKLGETDKIYGTLVDITTTYVEIGKVLNTTTKPTQNEQRTSSTHHRNNRIRSTCFIYY